MVQRRERLGLFHQMGDYFVGAILLLSLGRADVVAWPLVIGAVGLANAAMTRGPLAAFRRVRSRCATTPPTHLFWGRRHCSKVWWCGSPAASIVQGNSAVGSLACMAFDRPAPDLTKLLTAWEQWEKGEEMPGKVLANMKTAGLAEVLRELRDSGWKPSA
jgi:hypothetical protein